MSVLAEAVRKFCGLLAPRRRGRWFLAGLAENVEVLTDEHGVPHIYADSLEDACLVQGYLHARERGFQMELQRRVGQGRLAEILGPAALPADRFLRRLGLWRRTITLFPELDPQVQKLLLAYSRGVNLGFRRIRPPEAWLLGFRFEQWTALHSLLWTLVMAFDMGNNWEAEWVRWELLQKLGPEGARRFHLEHPEELPSGAGPACGAAMDGLWQDYTAARSVLDEFISWGGGSNAWAVSPRLSRSGKALLASDPHVISKVPSTWFEVHLETSDLRLYGVSLPGVPGVVLGHSEHLAWGITNSFVDCQDLVIERLENGHVRRPQGLVPLNPREERIRVRGGAEHVEVMHDTDSGPVLFEAGEGSAVSLRWTGWSGVDRTLSAWFGLWSCQTVAEAQKTLRSWGNPALNFVLADSQGNIGYQLAGKVPVRRDSWGIIPQAGWESRGEWIGIVPPEQLPSVLNPDCGYVVSANQAPHPLDQEPFLGVDFSDGYRAQRLRDELSKGDVDLEACARLQTDTLSLAALEFLGYLRRDWPGGGAAPELFAELLGWDGRLRAESRPAAVYQVFLLKLVEQAYRPQLPGPLFERWCGAPISTVGILGGLAGRYISFLLRAWSSGEPPGPSSPGWPELLRAAWDAALVELQNRLGDNPQEWRWGRLHVFRPTHPLGVVEALAPVVNAPAVELGGDVTTVLQSAVLPQDPYATRGWVPSYRLLVELGCPVHSRSVLPTGQSGWVGDRWNFDQQALWRQGLHHSSWWERRGLEHQRPERLILLARRF